MKFKRILCSAIAAATALVSTLTVMPVIPTEAAYITFVEGDIDNSGKVDLNDLTIMSKYLLGKIGLDNNAMRRADANNDKLIDQVDYKKINAVNMQQISAQTKSDYTYSDLENSDLTIWKHDYEDGNALTHFDEYPIYAPGNAYTYSSNGKRRMRQSSPLQLDTENITTVRIEQKQSDGTMRHMGTGFIVDKHIVATAAHVLCGRTGENNTGDLIAIDNLYVAVYDENSNANASTLLGRSKVKSFQIPKPYVTNNNGNAYQAYDYGMIYVRDDLSKFVKKSTVNPTTEKKVSIGYPTKEFIDNKNVDNSNIVYIDGYTNDGRRYYSGGRCFSMDDERYLMIANYTNYGQSGGPAYYETLYNGKIVRTVIGILGGFDCYSKDGHRSYGARCCKITPTIARFLLNNPYAN